MRIGMLCHNYTPHPGGLEVMVRNLVRGLSGRHEVILVTTAWDGARGRSEEEGLTVHRLPALHLAERFGVPYPLPLGPGLHSALKALQAIDVFHVHGSLYASSALGALLSRRQGVPLILTEHVGFVSFRRALVNAIESAAWSLIGDSIGEAADTLTTYNTRVQEWLAKRFPSKSIRYIGNGVDVATFRPRPLAERVELRRSFGLPVDKTLVLYAGRASEKKNLDHVLRIPRDKFHLVVCGWKRDLRDQGLTDLGALPHERMPDLFSCVDLMVHASEGEGLPLAVQEGIASGLPLVLLWDSGYSGWISQDAILSCPTLDGIGPAVIELAGAPGRRIELSSRARAWAEARWSWKATVDAYEVVYHEAIQRRLLDG